jgi:hypothetical protein
MAASGRLITSPLLIYIAKCADNKDIAACEHRVSHRISGISTFQSWGQAVDDLKGAEGGAYYGGEVDRLLICNFPFVYKDLIVQALKFYSLENT